MGRRAAGYLGQIGRTGGRLGNPLCTRDIPNHRGIVGIRPPAGQGSPVPMMKCPRKISSRGCWPI